MKREPKRRISPAKILVVIAVAGAVLFGLLLGFLAWSNDSFPTRTGRFSDYAEVKSAVFNGTEYAFTLTWESPSYLPLYAQLTSTASEAANTPVCDLQLSSVNASQSIFMPFGLSSPSSSLSNVDLQIAVQSSHNGTRFTIDFHVDTVEAAQGNIQPQALSCSQRAAPP